MLKCPAAFVDSMPPLGDGLVRLIELLKHVSWPVEDNNRTMVKVHLQV